MREGAYSGALAVAAVFAGSFLLFLVQPLVGRTLLPVFGGSASVWTACLAGYQALLLLGYAYAHAVAGRGAAGRRLHAWALAAAAALAWGAALGRGALLGWLGRGAGGSALVLAGVALLAGGPYVALAAGGTLVQAWRAGGGRGVYRLYAVSNLGSFLGLLGYPFLLEPRVSLTAQWTGFAAAVSGYALLLAAVSRRGPAAAAPAVAPGRDEVAAGGRGPREALWYLLPGASAFLLNAVTAQMFVDVTPMPMLWALLLAAFLLSYVVGFSPLGERRTWLWCVLAGVSLAGAAVARGVWGAAGFLPNVAAGLATVFYVGVVLHGWLYAERPAPARLTRYYLAVAAGGCAGGLLASVAAPLLFDRVSEYPLALLACAALTAWRAPKPRWLARRRWHAPACAAATAALWAALALVAARDSRARVLYRGRNFYGCLSVTQTLESFGPEGLAAVRYLWCGQTTHGIQVLTPERRRRGTAYYGETGGGLAVLAHPRYAAGQGMKVGVVGLGAGTMACYGRPNDLYRFYEINPLVVRVATDPALFSYLREAATPIDLVAGDARRMLAREREAGDPRYDVLVVDAYSGDAVPYHLATREAFALYLERLEEDGILAVHVSNWHVDLLPLCKAVAAELGVCAYGVASATEDSVTFGSVWVLMTRQPRAYRYPGQARAREVVWSEVRDVALPTDERGSLIGLVRW